MPIEKWYQIESPVEDEELIHYTESLNVIFLDISQRLGSFSVEDDFDTISTVNLHLSGTLEVDGATTLTGAVTMAAGLTVTGNIAVSGTVDGVDIAALKTSYDAHLHDGDTLQLDAVNSNGGTFAFDTTGAITFNQPIYLTSEAAFEENANLVYDPANDPANPLLRAVQKSTELYPPIWVQKEFKNTTANHYVGAAFFGTYKTGAGSHVSGLQGHMVQEAASGHAIAIHGRGYKEGAGPVWGMWAYAKRVSGGAAGNMFGIEVTLEPDVDLSESGGDILSGTDDIGMVVTTESASYPAKAAYVISQSDGQITKGFYNGLLFNTAAIVAAGVGINLVSAVPTYGIKFGGITSGGAHLYRAGELRTKTTSYNITIYTSNTCIWRTSDDTNDKMILDASGHLWIDGILKGDYGGAKKGGALNTRAGNNAFNADWDGNDDLTLYVDDTAICHWNTGTADWQAGGP